MKNLSLALFVMMWAVASCLPRSTLAAPNEIDMSPVPPPSSFEQAISYLRSDSAEEHIVGMWAVLGYRARASEAMPLIIDNLHYEPTSDVRSNAARVLGQLGPAADQAVPDLIDVLQNDSSINVQIDAANALGSIHNRKAVPILAQKLYQNDMELAIDSAKSISFITGEEFPDANSQGGYRIQGGVPLIVNAARDWWEKTGQHQDW